MVQIVLIRPGATDFDTQGRIQGTLDIPLSEQGAGEVERASGELRNLSLSMIYSSPCQSAWQTATTIASALGIKAKKLDALMNVDHGLWQGMLLEDVKRKNPKVFRQWQEHPEMVCPPEGEMLTDARERVEAALAKLQKKHKEGAIGLVCPDPVASVVHCIISHSQMSEMWKTKPPAGTWEILGVKCRTLVHRGCEVPMPENGVNPGSIPPPVSVQSSS